jgi:hypothetical protein
VARRAYGLPLGSRRRLVVISIALVVTVFVGLLLALQDRPPSESLEQVAFLVDSGYDDGNMDEIAHRELAGEVDRLAHVIDAEDWQVALTQMDATRATLHEKYEEGRVEVHVARRIENSLDDLDHAIRGARDR